MGISSWQKYKALAQEVTNWPRYFSFKFFSHATPATFTLRKSGAIIHIPYAMLRVFKEVFMQDGYNHAFVQAHLRPNTKVLDIGANIGLFSAWVANHFPQHPIEAYEPLPGNLSFLKQNVQAANGKSSQITVIEKAVTGKPVDTISFYFNKDSALSDSASVIAGFFNNHDSITVNAVTLQQVVAAATQRIGLLKMDCEGSEYDILYNTAAAVFEQIDSMIIETHDLDEKDNNVNAVLRFLHQLGFTCTCTHVVHGLNIIWATNNKVFATNP